MIDARRRSVLPSSLPPRGLSRVESAEYIGVSATKFDQMVVDGRMPKPKRIDGRVVWDRLQLDMAFAALPNEGSEFEPTSSNGAPPVFAL
jgi:predicted DNA-binding transcriptional regulator AlpA